MNQPSDAAKPPVLCVDLDGTLVWTDTLYELFFAALRRNPLNAVRIPFWVLRGRPVLKRKLWAAARLAVASLPYRTELIDFLRSEKAQGRELVLATAADQAAAEAIGRYLGLFDRHFGSANGTNLKGSHKAALLTQTFGEGGFAYAGDSRADIAVWAKAGSAILIDNGTNLADEISVPIELSLASTAPRWRDYIWPRRWPKATSCE
jgi:phosphoglycolate phosphatase-like HAD superfamily hydrolase